MTVKEVLDKKYMSGEIDFKELNKLYKEHKEHLTADYETYTTLKNAFAGNEEVTMNDIFKSIFDTMFYVKASAPISPNYTEKKTESKPIKPILKDSYTNRKDEENFNKLMLTMNNPPLFEWTGEPKPIYDDNKTIIFRVKED